jgi:hypothetical protein
MVGEKNARELGAGSGGRRLMKRLQVRLSLEKPQRVMGGADAEPKAKGRLQVTRDERQQQHQRQRDQSGATVL